MTQRLWLTEPGRKTCLATVEDTRGEWLCVDRALFAPKSRACRHPQPADKGIVWLDGEKRRLAGAKWMDGDPWLRLRGMVPAVGDTLQCELDQPWRDAMARGHTAMHLLLAASDAAMVADPEVRGDGHVRLTMRDFIAPQRLAAWLRQANQWIDDDVPIAAHFVDRAEAERFATPQDFSPPDPVPGGDVMALVEVPGVCAYPCDGTHVDRTGRVGRIVIVHARPGKEGFVVVARAV